MNKQIILLFIILAIFFGLGYRTGERFGKKDRCPWNIIEQSRTEGYRMGYQRGYIDRWNDNDFDDEYIVNPKQTLNK